MPAAGSQARPPDIDRHADGVMGRLKRNHPAERKAQVAQSALRRSRRFQALFHFFGYHDTIAAFTLGPVERLIGMDKQRAQLVAGSGSHRDAEAG